MKFARVIRARTFLAILFLFSSLLTTQTLEANNCKAIFSNAFSKPPAVFNKSLERLIHETGLTAEQSTVLHASAKVVHAKDYIKIFDQLKPGFILGVDKLNLAVEVFSSARGLLHWSDGYRDRKLVPRGPYHTEYYMDAITSSGRPIVFLIPPYIMRMPGITYHELMWMLKNPTRLSNVTFVFGAYELLPLELVRDYKRIRNKAPLIEYLDTHR